MKAYVLLRVYVLLHVCVCPVGFMHMKEEGEANEENDGEEEDHEEDSKVWFA